jgi:integrase
LDSANTRSSRLRLQIPRSKTDTTGQGAELGIPRGGKPETCPVRALEAWLEASGCRFGPVFRKVNRWGDIEPAALHPDAVRQILRRRAAQAGLTVSGLEWLSPHGLRAGFITEAYRQGARTRRSWTTRATAISGPCGAMSAAPSC